MIVLNEHNKKRFNLTKQNVLQKGGSEIIHFSDTESDSQDLEGRIYKILQDKEKHKFEKKDIVVHTGDILNSFLKSQKEVENLLELYQLASTENNKDVIDECEKNLNLLLSSLFISSSNKPPL